MGNTRRFSITKAQGELISLALVALIDELEKFSEKSADIYWKILLERSRQLKHDISTYKWYKTE